MPEYVCNTSPLQYLHQAGVLRLLNDLVGNVFVPPAVVSEIDRGLVLGINLPVLDALDWIVVRAPLGAATLPPSPVIGPGESEVIVLASELRDAVAILDDRLARSVARSLDVQFVGTLGLLVDAKRNGFMPSVSPILDVLEGLGFRFNRQTRATILRMAGELP